MKKKRILAIVGRPGAGKATAIAKRVKSTKEMHPYRGEVVARL